MTNKLIILVFYQQSIYVQSSAQQSLYIFCKWLIKVWIGSFSTCPVYFKSTDADFFAYYPA